MIVSTDALAFVTASYRSQSGVASRTLRACQWRTLGHWATHLYFPTVRTTTEHSVLTQYPLGASTLCPTEHDDFCAQVHAGHALQYRSKEVYSRPYLYTES